MDEPKAKKLLDRCRKDLIRCDFCTTILVDIKGLPCDHLLCNECFRGLVQSNGTLICCSCFKVFPSGSTGRDIPFLIKFNKVLTKHLESQNCQEPAGGRVMNRTHGPKRPQPPNKPAAEPFAKRSRGHKNMSHTRDSASCPLTDRPNEISFTSAAGYVHAPCAPPKMPGLVPKSLPPPQSPHSKTAVRDPGPPPKSAAASKDLVADPKTLSDSGVQSARSLGLEPVPIPAPKARYPRAKPGPSGLQNAGSGDQSPGWSRVKRASREMCRNEQTLKALDVSGGDLCKTVVTPHTTQTPSSASNEAGKEGPERNVRKAFRRLSKNKSLAGSSECEGRTSLSPFEKSAGIFHLSAGQDMGLEKTAQDNAKASAGNVGEDKATTIAGKVAGDKAKASAGKVAEDKAKASAGKVSKDKAMASAAKMAEDKAKASTGKVSKDKAEAHAGKNANDKAKASAGKVSKDKAEAHAGKNANDKAKASAGKNANDKAMASAGMVGEDMASASAGKVNQGKPFKTYARKAAPKKAQADSDKVALEKAMAEAEVAAQDKAKADFEKAAHDKAKADGKKAARDKAEADSDKGREKLKATTVKARRKSAMTGAENLTQETVSGDADMPIEEIALNDKEASDNLVTNATQFNRPVRARKAPAYLDTILNCKVQVADIKKLKTVVIEPSPMDKKDEGAATNKPKRNMKELIAKHDSKKSIENVKKVLDKLQDSGEGFYEDERFNSDLLPRLENRAANPHADVSCTLSEEDDQDFVGFPSFNKSDSETTRLPTSCDVVRSNYSDAAAMQIDDEEPPQEYRDPLPTKTIVPPAKLVASRSRDSAFKKMPDNTVRKTFSLEADTQDLATIAVNEEDSFDQRIAEIAEANKSNRASSENADNVLTNVTNSLIKSKSKVAGSQKKLETDAVLKPSKVPASDPSVEELVERFRCYLTNKPVANEFPTKELSQTEFRKVRMFLVASKGPFESADGAPLPGKRVLLELEPGELSSLVTIQSKRGARKASNCVCAHGNVSDHSDESMHSMLVNYTEPCDLTVKRGAIPGNSPDQPPVVAVAPPKDKVTSVHQPTTTQSIGSQYTQLSAYDTALESFSGNSQPTDVRRPLSASSFSASLQAALSPPFNQAFNQTAKADFNKHMGTQGGGDSIQPNTQERTLSRLKYILPKSQEVSNKELSAATKTASGLASMSPIVRVRSSAELSDSDPNFISDTPQHLPPKKVPVRIEWPTKSPMPLNLSGNVTIPVKVGNRITITKTVTHSAGLRAIAPAAPIGQTSNVAPQQNQPVVISNVRPVTGAAKQTETGVGADDSDEDVVGSSQTRALQPQAVQSREIGTKTNVGPKGKVTEKILGKTGNKPQPRSRKQSFVPRLTDPQASATQTKDVCVGKTLEAGSRKFKRIRAPSNSSGDEARPCGTVVLSSDDDDDDLPMRMSGDQQPDSMELLVNEHCRIPGGTRRQPDEDDVDIVALPPTPAVVAAVGRPSQEDATLIDNDLTFMEEFPEHREEAVNVCDAEDDSEDIVRPTPVTTFVRPKSFRQLSARQPLALSPRPEESVYGHMPENVSTPDEPTMCPQAAHLIGSSLSREDTRLLSKLAAAVGATLDAEFTIETTHLVMPTDEHGAAPRTVKFFLALASGAWVVSPTWIHKCVAAGALLQASRYEARDGVYGDSPRRSRLAGGGVFKDFEFFVVPPYTGPIEENVFKLVLRLAGGAVLEEARDTANKKYSVALIELEDTPEQKKLNEVYMNERRSLMLAYTWVHSTISAFGLRPVWKHLPKDVTVPLMLRCSYPADLFRESTSEDEYSDEND